MPRPPKEPMTPEKREEVMQLVEGIDQDVLDAMSYKNRMRLTHCDSDKVTLRQQQQAGLEWRAALVAHPEIRKRIVAKAMENPIEVLKIVAQESPKELHVDGTVNHKIVAIPATLSAEEWDKQVKIISQEEDEWKV